MNIVIGWVGGDSSLAISRKHLIPIRAPSPGKTSKPKKTLQIRIVSLPKVLGQISSVKMDRHTYKDKTYRSATFAVKNSSKFPSLRKKNNIWIHKYFPSGWGHAGSPTVVFCLRK